MDKTGSVRASAEVTTVAGAPEGEEAAGQGRESAASQMVAGMAGSNQDEAEARGSVMESEPVHDEQGTEGDSGAAMDEELRKFIEKFNQAPGGKVYMQDFKADLRKIPADAKFAHADEK